jgi:hypothetical protein
MVDFLLPFLKLFPCLLGRFLRFVLLVFLALARIAVLPLVVILLAAQIDLLLFLELRPRLRRPVLKEGQG